MFFVILLASVLLLFTVFMAAIIAFDTQRVLVLMRRSPSVIARYRHELPNVLAILARAGSPAWPERVSGLPIYLFKRRLRRLMPDEDSYALVDSHLGLWLYVEDHRDLLNLGLSTAITRLARSICDVGDDGKRARYGGMLLRAQEQQQELYAALQPRFGTRCLPLVERTLAELRSIEIVFVEHGYELHEGFAHLRELEEAMTPSAYAA